MCYIIISRLIPQWAALTRIQLLNQSPLAPYTTSTGSAVENISAWCWATQKLTSLITESKCQTGPTKKPTTRTEFYLAGRSKAWKLTKLSPWLVCSAKDSDSTKVTTRRLGRSTQTSNKSKVPGPGLSKLSATEVPPQTLLRTAPRVKSSVTKLQSTSVKGLRRTPPKSSLMETSSKFQISWWQVWPSPTGTTTSILGVLSGLTAWRLWSNSLSISLSWIIWCVFVKSWAPILCHVSNALCEAEK